jgi:hypothetical protein
LTVGTLMDGWMDGWMDWFGLLFIYLFIYLLIPNNREPEVLLRKIQ